jgi:hypothetical protein
MLLWNQPTLRIGVKESSRRGTKSGAGAFVCESGEQKNCGWSKSAERAKNRSCNASNGGAHEHFQCEILMI